MDWRNQPKSFWRERLSETQYRILREAGTERAFTGEFWNDKREGEYRCAGCGTPLFSSAAKYESGTGWPSFFEPLTSEGAPRLETRTDRSLAVPRTEVLCATCGGHLGHLFDDGPAPTGLRYCLNSGALAFAGKGAKK
jgi:peptide-methionine (R)-S-oxide reductase